MFRQKKTILLIKIMGSLTITWHLQINNFDKEKKIVKLYLSPDFFTLRKPQTGPYFKEVNGKKNYTFTFIYVSLSVVAFNLSFSFPSTC